MVTLPDIVKAYERHHICDKLNRWNWDKIKAAKALGISLSTLYRKITKLSIERNDS